MRTRAALVALTAGGVMVLTACGGGGGAPNAAPVAAHVSSPPAASTDAASDAAASASADASASASAAVAPSPGSTLATVQGEGRVNIVSNAQGQGFTLVDSVMDGTSDDSYLQAYDAAGNPLARIPPGSLTGECGADDVITPRGRLLIAEKDVHQDAQGIQSATDTLNLVAFDAVTGAQVWTTTLIRDTTDGISCTAFGGYLGSRNTADTTFTTTFDGHWGVYQPDDRQDMSHSMAIDLTTGRTYPRPDLYGALGNWVTIAKRDGTIYNTLQSLTLTTPGSWPTLGTLTFGDGGLLEGLSGPFDLNLAMPGAQPSSSEPAAAAITPDGNTLIGTQANGAQDERSATVAYALPTMKKPWSLETPQYATYTIAAVSNAIVVIQSDNQDGSTELTALNTRTDATVWKQSIQSGASVCALTSTELVVLANSQLAFLGADDGRQTGYVADTDQDSAGDPACPTVLSGGVSGLELDGSTVAQLATP